MRRLALLAAGLTIGGSLTVGASLAFSATATASSGTTSRPTHPEAAPPHRQDAPQKGVTSGSQWTFYYYGWEGTGDICETLTFAAHTFTGDNLSVGAWSGNIKLTFTSGVDYHAGDVYKGKLKKSGTYAGDYVGAVTSNGTSYAPFVLKSGSFC